MTDKEIRDSGLAWIPKSDCLKKRNLFNRLDQEVEITVPLCAINGRGKNATEDTERSFSVLSVAFFLWLCPDPNLGIEV
jgi:hypothetical protein